jgi:hypothetical protein
MKPAVNSSGLGLNCKTLGGSSNILIPIFNHINTGTKLVLATIWQQPIVKKLMHLPMVKLALLKKVTMDTLFVHAARLFWVELRKMIMASSRFTSNY